MRDKTISATEAARSFSEVLNQVQYRDMSFSIERGRKVVARLVPPALPAGLPLADLNALEAALKAELLKNPEIGLHLYADQDVVYSKVAEVMATVQHAGITKIAFVTMEQ